MIKVGSQASAAAPEESILNLNRTLYLNRTLNLKRTLLFSFFLEDYMAVKDSFILDTEVMKKLNKNAIVMHPLPRVNEITTDVDKDPRAIYFKEVKKALYIRMALLEQLFAN